MIAQELGFTVRARTGPALSRRGRLLAEPRDTGADLGRVAFQPGLPDVSAFPCGLWSRLLAREQREVRPGKVGYDGAGGHLGPRPVHGLLLGFAATPEAHARAALGIVGEAIAGRRAHRAGADCEDAQAT